MYGSFCPDSGDILGKGVMSELGFELESTIVYMDSQSAPTIESIKNILSYTSN